MRTVAKFRLFSAAAQGDVAARVVEVVDRWSEEKFQVAADGSAVIRRSGRTAAFDRTQEDLGDASQTTFLTLEHVPEGELQVQIRVLRNAEGTRLQCNLAIGSEGGVRLPRLDVRSPKFIREIAALGLGWQVGPDSERVFAKCFDVGPDDVDVLVDLLQASQRRLPIMVVSEIQGGTLAGDLHERIAADTCGLAHTCRLSHEASWQLTAKVGREWSCYNGAARLYWPFRMNRDDFRAHPLWTFDRLMRWASTEVEARDRFRRDVMEQLVEASTFVADDPAFARFETERSRHAIDAGRTSLTVGGDYKALADMYAADNDDLRAALDAKIRENDVLQQNVDALTLALRTSPRPSGGEVEGVDEGAPPETVYAAVEMARSRLSDSVAFPDDLERQLETLNPTAGPPEKILRYLDTLGELAEARANGGALGRSVPIWLRDRGVECSGDSLSGRQGEAGQRRIFEVLGENCDCEFHAKPSDGVSPDMCARIYFAVSESKPHVRVGYIGCHF